MTTKRLVIACFSLFSLGLWTGQVHAQESALLDSLISPSSARSLTDRPLSPASDARTTKAFIAKTAATKKVVASKDVKGKTKQAKAEGKAAKSVKTASAKTQTKSHKGFTAASMVVRKKKGAGTASP